jgi:IS5 family transposase
MERQLWNAIVQVISEINKPNLSRNFHFSIDQVLRVWFWAVVHDRPVSWATERENWPFYLRRDLLPSDSTMSRRLRSKPVQEVLKRLEQRVLAPKDTGQLVWMIDGKPLPIGGCSKDRQAGYGRAASTMARGYKLHALVGKRGEIAEWRVAPMNKDERTMAKRMVKASSIVGYIVGDKNYDSNPLHQICDDTGRLQLVARRRKGSHRGLAKGRHAAGRLRSKEMLESPFAEFANDLINQRDSIERFFGNLCNWGGGLACLPAWARTWRRVHRWVQAKLIASRLKEMINA